MIEPVGMYPEEMLARAAELRGENKTLGQVAYLLGVPRSTVANWDAAGYRRARSWVRSDGVLQSRRDSR